MSGEPEPQDMKLPKHWELLGPAPVPSHLFSRETQKYAYVRARCLHCARETVVRRHTFRETVPCRCVNLAVQSRKMGKFMKWATGKM